MWSSKELGYVLWVYVVAMCWAMCCGYVLWLYVVGGAMRSCAKLCKPDTLLYVNWRSDLGFFEFPMPILKATI